MNASLNGYNPGRNGNGSSAKSSGMLPDQGSYDAQSSVDGISRPELDDYVDLFSDSRGFSIPTPLSSIEESAESMDYPSEQRRRLSRSVSFGDRMWQSLAEGASDITRFLDDTAAQAPSKKKFKWSWTDFWGKLLYNYYNWRQDTVSDLQLFVLVNCSLLVLGGVIRRSLVDSDSVGDKLTSYWQDLYEVIVLTFGQEFPEATADFAQQLFSVCVAVVGLATFALVLALTEQVVLEVLEDNVKRGSPVYETGHVLILGWCKSQRDLETVRKILQQLCLAYSSEGGTTVVVLTQREKLEMEAIFRRAVPDEERCGTKFVFRYGSPLIPEDLAMVSANSARATIIVSDQSRNPDEADGQALRCAILLDELEEPRMSAQRANNLSMESGDFAYDTVLPAKNGRKKLKKRGGPTFFEGENGVEDGRKAAVGHVVVEMKTANAMPLLKYACSRRVAALPTGQLNAQRLATMVKHPVISVVSQRMFNFENSSTNFMHHFPALEGRRFGDLAFMFPDATVLGVSNPGEASVCYAPPLEYKLGPNDELIMLRPTRVRARNYAPLSAPLELASLNAWDPSLMELVGAANVSQKAAEEILQANSSVDMSMTWRTKQRQREKQCSMVFMVPDEYFEVNDDPERVMVCGWAEQSFMMDLLRELDHGSSCLPPGSEVIFLNSHDADTTLGEALRSVSLQNVNVSHVMADPLQRTQLARIDITNISCAIVLCDERWVDPDMDDSNGVDSLDERDVLRLDSLVMVVQLNIRKLLEDNDLRPINIICQKVASEGLTRFEDRHRLPLGISVNFTSFAAKLLTQVAFNPRSLLSFYKMGENANLTITDAGEYCEINECISYWELIARAQRCGDVLMGYYAIPDEMDKPLEHVLNPMGLEVRCKKRVWNCGDGRLKFIIMRKKYGAANSSNTRSFEEDMLRVAKQAQWVAMRDN